MNELFDKTCLACSKLITNNYSTSFSLGIKVLDQKFHPAIYAIYGFVRYADEIVDTFHEHDKKRLLETFKTDTYQAIADKISFNPVLHSFQWAVNEYAITYDLIDAFLLSMEMDLDKTKYRQDQYDAYIYGSAEVVGLMCLRVFCYGNEAQYQSLVAPARRLGAAFQKVNFIRDIKSDFEERGRMYFPNTDFQNFTAKQKQLIETDIEADFEASLEGIRKLPVGAKLGVYLAYVYYRALFSKIKKMPAATILNQRIRIPDGYKIWLLVKSYVELSWLGKLQFKENLA
jgi:phytoene synthase